jgi:CBS-domain-containing membrane protein
MEERQVRRLPVLDRNKHLVGIISLGDIGVHSQPAFGGQALKEISRSHGT